MSSTLGTFFKVTTFGESHGKGVGAIVDGCPPGLALSEKDIQPQLDAEPPEPVHGLEAFFIGFHQTIPSTKKPGSQDCRV